MRRGHTRRAHVALVALAAVSCGSDDEASDTTIAFATTLAVASTATAPTSTAPSSTATATTLAPELLAAIPVAEGPIRLAASDDEIWVEAHRADIVTVIDPEQDVEVEQLADAPVHCDVAVGGGFVWASRAAGSTVVQIDPTTRRVVTTLELTEACGLAADDENLWVTSPALGAVLRYDVATLERQSSVEVGELVFAVRIGEDAVWAFGEAEGGATWRISPDGSEVTATVETPGAGDIVLGFDSVWVSARDLQVIYRIDQATAELTDTIEVDGAIAGIGVGPDALWVTGFGNGAVYRIDPDTNEIAGTFDTGLGNLGPPIVAFDSVWTSALDANLVLRLDPEAIRD